jgi:hypothetical protein
MSFSDGFARREWLYSTNYSLHLPRRATATSLLRGSDHAAQMYIRAPTRWLIVSMSHWD